MRDTLYILRAGDKHAASEYYRERGTVVYFRRESGRVIAAQTSIAYSPEEIKAELGQVKELRADQTDRKMGQAAIIGMRTLTESYGEVTEKPVPFYVFK